MDFIHYTTGQYSQKKKREDMMSNLFGDQQKEMSFIPKTYPSEDPQII